MTTCPHFRPTIKYTEQQKKDLELITEVHFKFNNREDYKYDSEKIENAYKNLMQLGKGYEFVKEKVDRAYKELKGEPTHKILNETDRLRLKRESKNIRERVSCYDF